MRGIFCAVLFVVSAFSLVGASPRISVPPPSAEAGTVPPPEYVIDYYAPPPDWMPATQIELYNLNTRVPDLLWLKYDGANTLALRIRPISKEQLQQDIEVGLINPTRARTALDFSDDAEKNVNNRRVLVTKLSVPGDDFVEFSFKMKAKTKNPNPEVRVAADGLGVVINTLKDADASVPTKDGFSAYKIKFVAKKNAVLRGIVITLPPAASYDPDEEYVFFDLHLKRTAPRPRFTDLPRRQWILNSAFEEDRPLSVVDGIEDVVAFVNSGTNAVTSIDLPITGYELREQTEKEKDDGFKVEKVKTTLNGESVDALRVILQKGSRCYLKFPVRFNATEYNVMSFYAKVEIPDGVDQRRVYGENVPNLYGTYAGLLNGFYDTFSFGLHSATKDHVDWNQYGVSQGLTAWHRQRGAKTSDGWRAVALDLVNGDFAGNKNTYLPEITHWCFYYDNSKIPEGKKAVVTIALPKVTKGLMEAGGDIPKYKKFLAEREKFLDRKIPKISDFLGAPLANRLPEPLPFIRGHVPAGEIIMPNRAYKPAYGRVVDRAVAYMQDLLKNKYGLAALVPVLSTPTTNDNVKIFLGSGWFAAVDGELCRADKEKLAGSPGCAIRARGKNIYIYGGNHNYAQEARGIANGIYVFIENNTDEIMVQFRDSKRQLHARQVFDFDKSGDMDLLWGDDYLNVPPLQYWTVFGNEAYMDRNMDFPDNWHLGRWEFAGRRQHTTNHWWGYGAHLDLPDGKEDWDTPNENWGLSLEGKRVKPGCYTSHPCMVNVLERAKAAFLKKAFNKLEDNPQSPKGQAYIFKQQDVFGLWVEDTHNVCHCEKCVTPIRLANGELVTIDNPAFRGTQFFANACAMIHAVNVHAKRNMQIESIGYLWMSSIPLFEISRNYVIRFCPYIRKNYFVPIYAPCNDLFWRDFYRWSQLDIDVGIYEYFLYVGTRPWVDIFRYDFKEEVDLGLKFATPESDMSQLPQLEHWTLARFFWNPDADPVELRSYYIARVFREAAEDVAKFYFALHDFIYREYAFNTSLEFEDMEQVGTLAWMTKSQKFPKMTVAEELNSYIEAALGKVKNPMSREMLSMLAADWKAYYEKSRKNAESLK